MRKRQQHRGLSQSRIYPKRKRFYLFNPEPIENPATGKVSKWHSLCPIEDGEHVARVKANDIIKHNSPGDGAGNLPAYMEKYRLILIKKRDKDAPIEPARLKMWKEGTKEVTRQCTRIAEAFADFDVDQVLPVDIASFVDQWEGQRMAQLWHSRLSGFFTWCCRKGYMTSNPCREVKVEKPKANKAYLSHADFYAIREAALLGKDGRPTASGPRLQCYMDLCYLMYQRSTEIRLLKKNRIDLAKMQIEFTPTKTERSSGASVIVPISEAIAEVIRRAMNFSKKECTYLFHTDEEQPYTTNGIGTAFRRAAERAGIEGATLKGLRAKALTDAKIAGYEMKQLRIAAAHTDEAMTEEYIKIRLPERSEVILAMPPRE